MKKTRYLATTACFSVSYCPSCCENRKLRAASLWSIPKDDLLAYSTPIYGRPME